MAQSHPAGAQGMLRAINERAVLELVDRVGPVSRVELARLSGLSKPTVSAALTSLVARGAVREAGQAGGRKGPAAVLYAVDPTHSMSMGIDIGHDRVRLAVADATGRVVARREEGTEQDTDALVRQVRRLCEATAADGGTAAAALTQLVVGVPASVAADGRRLHHTEGLPAGAERLGHALAAALPAPLRLENDVNLAALAEGSHGHGQGVDDFVLVSLGSGLGIGVVLGGRLHRGASGAAGEAGFLPGPCRPADGPAPPQEERDTVDTTIGAHHIRSLATRLGMPPGLTPREIFDRARAGDPAALEVVADTARTLAYVVACVAPVLDPSLVVLGGSIGSNRDLLLEPVTREVARISPLSPRLECSELGSEAVLVGAAETAAELAKEVAFTRLTGAPAAPAATH